MYLIVLVVFVLIMAALWSTGTAGFLIGGGVILAAMFAGTHVADVMERPEFATERRRQKEAGAPPWPSFWRAFVCAWRAPPPKPDPPASTPTGPMSNTKCRSCGVPIFAPGYSSDSYAAWYCPACYRAKFPR